MTWAQTGRGRALDLLDPQPDDVDLDEVARALGKLCRYNGQTRHFYSVAEHCVLVSGYLLTEHGDVRLALAGLLHDAAEAYVGDMPWPLQGVLWDAHPEARETYRRVMRGLDEAICRLVDLDPDLLHERRVKDADMRILVDERNALLGPPARPWFADQLGPLGVALQCWPHDVAAERWSRRLATLLACLPGHARPAGEGQRCGWCGALPAPSPPTGGGQPSVARAAGGPGGGR